MYYFFPSVRVTDVRVNEVRVVLTMSGISELTAVRSPTGVGTGRFVLSEFPWPVI